MRSHEYQRNYELEQSYWWFTGVHAMVDSLLSVSAGRGTLGKVLDVGCGTGALMDRLRGRSRELWGVDNAPEALDFCRKRGLPNLVLSDATDTPFPEGEFDVITAIGIIEHLPDDEAFLREMRRLLKPGGVMILLTSSFPFLWSMHDTANNHERRYYLRPLVGKLSKMGFERLRFSHLNFFLFPALAAALLTHRLLYGITSERPTRIMPEPPAAVNAMLTAILKLEAALMRWITLPWGVSMIGALRKVG